eukprot:m.41557 g.41557  ORF g.41557 m.41557 type:complete len:229 (-) comp12016_c0_seq2:220-906(-)
MASTVDLSAYNEEQVVMMDEMCIVVDPDDKPLRAETKKICHLMTNINQGLLHRAFSVFLFNTKGELLLQQRADEKITFPAYFTNTCCSHPLWLKDELEEAGQKGVRVAARRKLFQELGIKPENIELSDFQFMTRIHYLAPSDDVWGEHEVDYILFLQKDVEVTPNPIEVKSYRYISKDELKAFLAQGEKSDLKITPWFKLIVENFLYGWWDNLGTPSPAEEQARIHRM